MPCPPKGLQEVESKWRLCQKMGIEASAEMQDAAQKVLVENKALRLMLLNGECQMTKSTPTCLSSCGPFRVLKTSHRQYQALNY